MYTSSIVKNYFKNFSFSTMAKKDQERLSLFRKAA
tara:strand:+ start:2758 stop:2862 length:105 start_codon:yes stop_codon:yes gene_type:complete